MPPRKRTKIVQPWDADDETIEASRLLTNYRVYQWEDGSQLAGLFRRWQDGKLHMDGGVKRDRYGSKLLYWHPEHGYVEAGRVRRNALRSSKIADAGVALGEARVITHADEQEFPDESSNDGDDTREDDDSTRENGDEPIVLLCDGCDAEQSLAAAGFDAVPDGDWYCSVCVARRARESSASKAAEVEAGDLNARVAAAGRKWCIIGGRACPDMPLRARFCPRCCEPQVD